MIQRRIALLLRFRWCRGQTIGVTRTAWRLGFPWGGSRRPASARDEVDGDDKDGNRPNSDAVGAQVPQHGNLRRMAIAVEEGGGLNGSRGGGRLTPSGAGRQLRLHVL